MLSNAPQIMPGECDSRVAELHSRTSGLPRAANAGTAQLDLFGEVHAPIACRYFSGATRLNDARGIIETGLPLGVTATEMRSPAIVAEVRAYLRCGQRVFVDTGAFGIFKIQERARAAGQPAPAGIDFDAILGLYDQLLADLPSDARARLALVMPDCVGDQDGTLALLARYREKVSAYIADGVDVIVAVQSGQRPAQHALVETVRILGTDAFRAGVPSRAAAMSDRELGSLRHGRFHLLGQAAPTKSLRRRAFLLVHGNGLAVDITADANLLRAHYHRIAAGQRARCAQIGTTIAFGEIVDDTELISDIVEGTRWLSGAELRALRTVIECLFGPQPESAWKRVHRTDSLGDYLGERYGVDATEAFVDHL